MSKDMEKMTTDLHRLLDAQSFDSEEDLMKFMDGLMGKRIPSIPMRDLTPEDKAQDLVYDAYDLPDEEEAAAFTNIIKALELDPDCIEAYEFLGEREVLPAIATAYFEKGISIGRRKFGGEYLKQHKGGFWGFHETRPFMRCMFHYSECLEAIGRLRESVEVMEEMIKLNPNDNQGVRDQLLLRLVQLDETQKYLKYAKKYKGDIFSFPMFTHALFLFKTTGESEEADAALTAALKANRFVAKKLLASKMITSVPDHYGLGDENEAIIIASYAQPVWKSTKGALAWLRKIDAKI